ncbi:hypothetical protein EDC01DRAFT_636552 [Geopyxis carbonaria]|nr:hypothetical protein EDC01DRAFT_636552 [Geopyxis carbonaria]
MYDPNLSCGIRQATSSSIHIVILYIPASVAAAAAAPLAPPLALPLHCIKPNKCILVAGTAITAGGIGIAIVMGPLLLPPQLKYNHAGFASKKKDLILELVSLSPRVFEFGYIACIFLWVARPVFGLWVLNVLSLPHLPCLNKVSSHIFCFKYIAVYTILGKPGCEMKAENSIIQTTQYKNTSNKSKSKGT